MDGGFFYLLLQISRPGAALVFPTRLDSVPGWAESFVGNLLVTNLA